jgi:3-phenylpropionate/trans-cinnamate dioxygenase ferredoxin component
MATVSEKPEGGMILPIHENKFVMRAKANDEIYTMDDICTHEEVPLHEGELRDNSCWVTCPWHAAHVDIRSSKVFQDTSWATNTETYEVEAEVDNVYVNL